MGVYFDSEDYVVWRHKRAARRKRFAYVIIVISLIVLAVMISIGK